VPEQEKLFLTLSNETSQKQIIVSTIWVKMKLQVMMIFKLISTIKDKFINPSIALVIPMTSLRKTLETVLKAGLNLIWL
jgi:hypothetical protein